MPAFAGVIFLRFLHDQIAVIPDHCQDQSAQVLPEPRRWDRPACRSYILPGKRTLHSPVSLSTTANPSLVLSFISSGFAKSVNLSLYGALCIRTEGPAVAALVAHVVHMDHLRHIHSRNLNGDIRTVRTYVHTVFTDFAAVQTSLRPRIPRLFLL